MTDITQLDVLGSDVDWDTFYGRYEDLRNILETGSDSDKSIAFQRVLRDYPYMVSDAIDVVHTLRNFTDISIFENTFTEICARHDTALSDKVRVALMYNTTLLHSIFLSNYENLDEVANLLISVKTVQSHKDLDNVLVSLLKNNNVSILQKVKIAFAFEEPLESDLLNEVYDCVTNLLIKMQIVHYLLLVDKHTGKFYEVLSDGTIDEWDRIRIVTDMEYTISDKDLLYKHVNAGAQHLIALTNYNSVKVVLCQYMFNTFESFADFDYYREVIFTVIRDVDLDMNVRADAVDVVVLNEQFTEEEREEALNVLSELSRNGLVVHNIYENQQNVHSKAIEQSAAQMLQSMLMKQCTEPYTLDDVEKELMHYTTDENADKVRKSICRIRMDRSVLRCMGSDMMKLSGILLVVFKYICKTEHRDEKLRRLAEELTDAHNVCATGIAIRMVNACSGFDDLALYIDIGDQIQARFSAKLSAMVMRMEDEDLRDEVLTQMTLPTDMFEQRKDFCEFVSGHFTELYSELKEEFLNDVSENDFDVYFSKSMHTYLLF